MSTGANWLPSGDTARSPQKNSPKLSDVTAYVAGSSEKTAPLELFKSAPKIWFPSGVDLSKSPVLMLSGLNVNEERSNSTARKPAKITLLKGVITMEPVIASTPIAVSVNNEG